MRILDLTILSLIDNQLELESLSSPSGRVGQSAELDRISRFEDVKQVYWGRSLEDPATVIILVGQYY
jgi:hypothetical protein